MLSTDAIPLLKQIPGLRYRQAWDLAYWSDWPYQEWIDVWTYRSNWIEICMEFSPSRLWRWNCFFEFNAAGEFCLWTPWVFFSVTLGG
jgi:hypothetical protein